MRLKNKKIIVTAAAQGIGRATALMFAKEGASVIATDINEEKLNELSKENDSIRTHKLDATNKNSVEEFCSTINSIVMAGCKPILTDIRKDTFNIDGAVGDFPFIANTFQV